MQYYIFAGRQKGYSCKVYEDTNKNSRKVPRNICIYIFTAVPVFYASPILFTSYKAYFTSNHSVDSFELFYKIA